MASAKHKPDRSPRLRNEQGKRAAAARSEGTIHYSERVSPPEPEYPATKRHNQETPVPLPPIQSAAGLIAEAMRRRQDQSIRPFANREEFEASVAYVIQHGIAAIEVATERNAERAARGGDPYIGFDKLINATVNAMDFYASMKGFKAQARHQTENVTLAFINTEQQRRMVQDPAYRDLVLGVESYEFSSGPSSRGDVSGEVRPHGVAGPVDHAASSPAPERTPSEDGVG